MKVKIGHYEWVVKEYEVPKKFENYFLKDEDEWTDKEWDFYDEHDVPVEVLNANGVEIDDWDSVEVEE